MNNQQYEEEMWKTVALLALGAVSSGTMFVFSHVKDEIGRPEMEGAIAIHDQQAFTQLRQDIRNDVRLEVRETMRDYDDSLLQMKFAVDQVRQSKRLTAKLNGR